MTLFNTSLSRQGRFMRSVAPARGLLRQSQNRLPRADPPIFCRRSAPLTPPRARRSFSASAYAAKEIVMSAAIMIAILIPMNGAGALDVDPASHPVSLPMTPMAASSPKLASLWADQIAAAKSRVEQTRAIAPDIKLTPAIDTLTASFKIGTDTLFVSAFAGACKDADWLPKGSENSIAYCPLRVAIISGGAMKLLAEAPSDVRRADVRSFGEDKQTIRRSRRSKFRRVRRKNAHDHRKSPEHTNSFLRGRR